MNLATGDTPGVGLADDAGGERQDGRRGEGGRPRERFQALVTASSPPDGDGLGDLAALAGVRDYPGRVKCATLPWHALRLAIEGRLEGMLSRSAEVVQKSR